MDASLQGFRWRVPIVLPVLLAVALVVALAAQSVRAVEVNRRAAASAVRDYAAFAAWQYTRRASDYLRLTIIASLRGHVTTPANTLACRINNGLVEITKNETHLSGAAVAEAVESAARNATRSRLSVGLAAVPGTDAFLGYALERDSTDAWTGCVGDVVRREALVAVFEHVAAFAPLLPPSLAGRAPNDSLVAIEVRSASGQPLAALGAAAEGTRAADVLGPDLADINIVATLRPAAIGRLIAGGIPSSNSGALAAMLAVTLVLCAVAVLQVRRTNEIIRLRSDFVASVSHELKTPLAQISLFADTLASRERSLDEQRRYLAIISREAKRLGHLVDSILRFAGMMRSDEADDAREPSQLVDEIRAAVAAIQPIAGARSMAIDVDSDVDIELPLDRDAFRQLMLNLLDNAIKFGPDHQHIHIHATFGGGRAVVTVDDEGPGVPPRDRERVFAPFVRGRVHRQRGSGIGLAVARDVVRRHGGTIRLESARGGGARVRIDLAGASARSSTGVVYA